MMTDEYGTIDEGMRYTSLPSICPTKSRTDLVLGIIMRKTALRILIALVTLFPAVVWPVLTTQHGLKPPSVFRSQIWIAIAFPLAT
jgi:hypothetical protein